MKPFGADQPSSPGGGVRAAVLALIALAGLASLVAGLYLGIPELIDRVREIGATPATTVPASTVPPVTTTTAGELTTTTSATDPTDTTVVTDDSGRLIVTVPVAWSDVNTSAWDRAGVPVGIQVGAAPDLAAWQNGWGTPGVFVGVSDSVGLDEALGEWGDACTSRLADEEFHPVGMEGTLRVWEDCGPEGSTFLEGVAQSPDGSVVLVYQAVVLGEADRTAADQVIATLGYLP